MSAGVDLPALPWTLQDQLIFWFYRIGAYALLNLIDEPAWLALIFC